MLIIDRGSLILSLLITCVYQLSTNAQKIDSKEGKCPPPTRPFCPRVSVDSCFGDVECPGKQKCCDDNCGNTVCSDPISAACDIAIDLGILVDASISTTPTNFNKIKTFIKDLVSEFDIREGKTHVAAIAFGNRAKVVFDFNELQGADLTREKLVKKIDEIPQMSGANRMDLALALASDRMFSFRSGKRDKTSRFLVIITDGIGTEWNQNSAKLQELAKALKDEQVELLVVAVGDNVRLDEFKEISSGENTVYNPKEFSDLKTLYREVALRSCKACSDAVDIGFAIPSNSFAQFDDIADFVKKTLDYVVPGTENVHVGLMIYHAKDAEVVIKFDQQFDLSELKKIINSLSFIDAGRGENRLDLLLKAAASDLFTLRSGVRQGVAKKLIVVGVEPKFTNKAAIDAAVEQLQSIGVDIIGVAYGSNVDTTTIKRISSFPLRENFKVAPTITDLLSRLPRSVVASSCKSKKGKCPYTKVPENCPANSFEQCQVDKDCSLDKKCCQNGCDRRCTAPRQGCFRALEIAFLVDTSYSVSDEELHRMKDFIKEVANGFSISETGARFSIVAYDKRARILLKFKDNFNAKKIFTEIENLDKTRNGERRLDLGLEMIQSDVFSLKSGVRQGVPGVLIILSGGPTSSSLNKLKEISTSLKRSVDIWTIESGPESSSRYLKDLASSSKQSHKSMFFENLPPFVHTITEKICSDKPGQCPKSWKNSCSSQKNLCVLDYECPGFSKCCYDGCQSICLNPSWVCSKPLDLAIVMESSRNLEETDFRKVKMFAKDLVKALNVDKSQTQIALLSYSEIVYTHFMFKRFQGYSNKEQNILRAIDRVDYSGDTNIAAHLALKRASSQLFTPVGGSRPGVVKGLIFITDGILPGDNSQIFREAMVLKQTGVAIYPIAASKNPNVAALEQIASESSAEHVFLATSLPAIIQYVHQISQEACRAEAPPRATEVLKGPPGDPGKPGSKGEQGPPGKPGRRGTSGNNGVSGPSGVAGTTGRPGPRGPAGPQGPPGAIFIRMAGQDANGQSRRVMATPARNVGQPGIKGRSGPRGVTGISGGAGMAGSKGETGTAGRLGKRGVTGNQGSIGKAGDNGNTGSPGRPGEKGERGDPGKSPGFGKNGIKGHKGALGPTGMHGERGDTGITGSPGKRGKPGHKGAGGIPGHVGKQGPTGVIGMRGKKGVDGIEGQKGPIGDPGTSGVIGKRGAKGFPGQFGPDGPRGFQGETGSPGLAGFDQPSGADGKKGDIGKPGPKGSVGDPGTTGPTGPASSTALQGFKGSSGSLGLKGKRGDEGNPGAEGPMGSKGAMGDVGVSGVYGVKGAQGKMGIQGDPGLAGPEGGEGERGIQGSRGFVGVDGIPGEKGKNGNRGALGINGKKGSMGRYGKVGSPGKLGRRGAKGRLGRPGNDGKPGVVGPPGDDGAPGSFGVKGSKGYAGIKGLVGPKGAPGPQGLAGPQGSLGGKGEQGLKGHTGDSGLTGFAGLPGEQGPRGLHGVDGLPGPQGPPGDQGSKGMKGAVGDKGPIGDAGEDGEGGEEGKRGGNGRQGDIGQRGLAGNSGGAGDRGPRGLTGIAGPLGIHGKPGKPGITGVLGHTGMPGAHGSKGKMGETGIQGMAGLPGGDGDPGINGGPGPVGASGEIGEKGEEGIPGIVGGPGKLGPTGPKGLAGIPGPAGKPGIPGPSGTYGGHGETGSRGTKGDSGLHGGRGLPGYSGDQGEPGLPGPSGTRGERGLSGVTGNQGATGHKGYRGHRGTRGDSGGEGTFGTTGEKGEKGDSGNLGDTGLAGPMGEKGEEGKQGEPGESPSVAQFGLRGLPGVPGSFGQSGNMGRVGHPGVRGEEGAAGLPGVNGKRGNMGPNGEQGFKGFKGTRGGYGGIGLQGLPGPSGSVGVNGKVGMKGLPGDYGTLGDLGPPGVVGLIGYAGPPGEKGIKGEKGDGGSDGLPGIAGPRGLWGRKGRSGPPGSYGYEGEKGASGEIGPNGFEGTRGDRGYQGDSGKPGFQGEEGFTGEKGFIGSRGDAGKMGPEGMKGQIGASGPLGEEGPKGYPGGMGPPGPPGRPGGPERTAFGSNRNNEGSRGQATDKPPDYYHGEEEAIGIGNRVSLSLEELEAELLTRLHHLYDDLASFQKPTGTKHFPALTCKNLFSDHSYLKSGNYWLDPNEGATEDAVQAYCDSEKKLTCISPIVKKTEMKQWYRGGDRYLWFKEDIDDNFKFRYTVESNQLTFLQLHSDKAKQKITYHCINSTAWHDKTNDVTHSIKLLGDNEREYTASTPRKHRPTVLSDECKIKDEERRSTVIEIVTDKTSRLPIRDIALYDIGDDGEQFGLEVGAVCFS